MKDRLVGRGGMVVLMVMVLACCRAEKSVGDASDGDATSSPQAVVRELYRHVIKHRPLGIPRGEFGAAIRPLLSTDLRERLQTTEACERDYYRTHTDPNEKPEFAWLELGLFTGWNDWAVTTKADLVRVAPQADGSVHVWVQLHSAYKNEYPWRVVAVVRRDRERFMVDDMLLNQNKSGGFDSRLTRWLGDGCDGPRWVGYPEREALR